MEKVMMVGNMVDQGMTTFEQKLDDHKHACMQKNGYLY